jgi:hypothetical protein
MIINSGFYITKSIILRQVAVIIRTSSKRCDVILRHNNLNSPPILTNIVIDSHRSLWFYKTCAVKEVSWNTVITTKEIYVHTHKPKQ